MMRYELKEVEQKIEETFPENRIIDFFLIQEDFISTGMSLAYLNKNGI